jgi:hypothetical protein
MQQVCVVNMSDPPACDMLTTQARPHPTTAAAMAAAAAAAAVLLPGGLEGAGHLCAFLVTVEAQMTSHMLGDSSTRAGADAARGWCVW